VTGLRSQQAEVDAQACGGGIQALVEGQVEEDGVVCRAGQPGVVGQFGFQLSGFPAGIAEGDLFGKEGGRLS
jgi:hypothetical protein